MTIETVNVPVKAFKTISLEMAKNDQQTKNLLATGFYEKHTIYIISRGVRQRGYKNFIDIGANFGYYTLLFSKALKGSLVYAFEPNPDVIPILAGNIEKNNLTNVKLHKFGLGDHATEMTLFSNHEDTGTTSVQKIPRHDLEHKVKISTLDYEIPKNLEIKFDFIKIDIQGYDLLALNGGRDLIKRDLPDIMIEYGPMEINITREELLETFTFLAAYDYDPFIFRAHDFFCLEPLSFEILINIFDLYKKHKTNGGFHIMFVSRLRPTTPIRNS